MTRPFNFRPSQPPAPRRPARTEDKGTPPPDFDPKAPMRLAKFLAMAGVASRRHSEELILNGQVTVNGEAVLTPAFNVVPADSDIRLNGKQVTLPDQKIYLLLNKPAGYTCTAQDPHAERLIYELIPKQFGRLFTVGRLDRDSEGLILLTNDGDWAQRLSHPSRRIERCYYVECEGNFTTELRRRLLDGVWDNGELLKPLEVTQLRHFVGHAQLEFRLAEGKNREVRRLCQAVGLQVTLLKRTSFGNVSLGNLPVGKWRKLTEDEIRI
ncbi:MAG: rRNA pseudouridine synthase [Victivallales bacterium]|nr:rRNA pseudouridine synthase [Victivallales bacterium]